MKSLITSQNSQVKSLDGKVYIVSNGLEQELRLGDALPQGSEILLADNANLELQLQDGSSFNSGEFSAPNESVSDAEIQQLQDLIAAGDDPTADLPATAAGGAPGNEGDSGFVSLVRDGAEALAGAGYDTQTILFSAGSTANGDSESFNLVAIANNDIQQIAEDTVATGNVLDNDSDNLGQVEVTSFIIDGVEYGAGTSVTLTSGTFTLNADGSYTFTPAENWNGEVPVISYNTSVGTTATLTLVVTPVDDPSIVQNDTVTVAEDTVASGNVLDNDSDVDDDLTVVSFEVNGNNYSAGDSVELDGGTLVLNADGSYSFTPNADWNGNVPVVTYTTNTGATATLTIVVTPVDDATNAVNDFNTVAEDTVASGNVLDNDSDVDDDLTVVSFEVNGNSYSAGDSVELDGGTLVLNADGSYSFTPNADWNGNVPVVTYTTNTGATATLTIVVTPVDDATNAVNDFNTVAEDTVASGNVLDNDSDVDDDLTVVSFEVNGNSYSAGDSVELDGGTLVLNADGSYSFTPNADWNGNVPVVTYTTNTGATATLTIVVTPVDDATNAVNDFNTVAEDTVASGNVLDNDSDVDNELSVVSFEVDGNSYSAGDSVELDGGTLVLNADGSYSFTPNADWNGNVPVVTYTTNTGATATLTIVVTPVDDATNAVNDFNTVAEDTVASGNVLDNDSDVDDDLTVVSFEVNGNSYSAGDSVELDGGILVLNADGSYSFTPNADWNGNVPVVTYTTNTGATATLTIVVTPVDDATNAVNDFNTVAEDTVASGNVLDNDSDVDDDLTVVSFEVNGNSYSAGDSVELDGGTLVLNADGSYSFTPNADWNGNVPVVTYTTNTGATATLTIVVTPVDDATNAVNDFNTVAEDTVASGNVLDNDSDVDDDLTVVSFEVNGNSYSAGDSVELDGGILVLNADGSYSFTPNADWNGNVPVVTYTTNTGATATLTIVVTPVDDATNAVNDFNTVAEDTVASGNVLDNDSDIDSELSVVSFTIAGDETVYSAGDSVELDGGTLVLNADGSYSFTPNADWNGNVPVVTYTTNTGATATLTIVVTPVDDATNAVNDFNTVAEDTVATGNVLDNDSDVDNELSVVSFEVDGNSYSAGDSVELDGGTLVLNADGSYSFTPNADWNGNVPVVTYTTNTGATATLTIVVTPVDDATNAVNDFNTVAEDTVASGNVLDNDSDIDNDLSVTSFEVDGNSYAAGSSVELDGGTLVLNADGSYSFTPNADWNGNVPVVTYTTNTGATATLTIVVTPVDDATNAVNDFNTVAEDTVASGNVLDNDSDVDDELSVVSFEVNGNSYSAGDSVELDGGTLVLNADGSYSFTPNADWNGNVPVVTYTTNTGATATLTIVVTPVDDATNAVNDFNTVAEDTVASGNVLDNDSDVDDDLTVVSFEVNGNNYSAGDSVELDGGTLVLNADGSYSFTPNADWNGNVPVVTYTTNTGATATLTIVVTPVDDATNAVNDFNTVAEDTVASGNVLDNDSDVDDDLTVVSFEVNGNSYSAGDSVELDGGTLVLNADGSYSFTPNADWNGNVPVVTYTTNTGATATLTIVVTPVDDATNAVNDFNTVAEDTVASGNVLDNDSDVDDDLSVASFEVNGNSYSAGDSVELDGGTLVLNADGSYSFTPNADWNGNVPVVTYTTNTGATATLTIVVTPVDDATNAVNDFNTVAEDTVASGNVLDNDSDVDDELSVVSFTIAGDETVYSAGDSVELDGGTLVLNADGSYSFTPNADWNGNVPVVTYTTNTGATATLTIVVTPVDDATNAVNDFNTVAEDTVASGNVLDNDSDVDDDLTVVSFEVNGNSYSAGDSVELDGGTLVLNADGSYSFTPNADWNGNVPVVTYTTNTGATATLTIVVTPVDDATNAVNDFNTVAEDTVASGNVLDNDSDVDDDLTVVSFEVNGNSYSAGDSVELDGGTLVLNADGSYSFTPNADWNGNVPVVTYTTNTGATATLTIVVTPVDDATNAVNDFNTVAEDTVASGNVLDNDSDVDDDLTVVSFEVNGNSYSAGDSVELDGGTLVLNADGSYSFTPNADWNGNVPVVTYTTNTGATATLTIVVTPVDDATNAVNDFNTVAEDTVASGNVLDNDSDIDSELSVVSFTIAGDETVYSAGDSVELDGGTLVLNADGSYSFTPNADWNGNVPVVTYTTNTGATATLTIVVTPVDDATNAVNDFNTVAEDTVASGNVLDNDSDVDDDLTVVSFEVNGNSYSAGDSVELDGGTLVLNADGSYSFTPNADWNGNVPVVTYTTNTGATATLTIVVTPVDDATNAVNDFNTVAEDTVASGNVLDNDSDVDDDLTVVSFEVNGNSYSAGDSVELDGGTLVLNADGSYSFTPNADWNGNVPVVTYTTNTGATATLTIVVTPVDDATNAVNDFNTVAEDTVASGNVLDNDSDVDDDLTVVSFEVNGNSYSAGDSVELDGGTLVLNADGSYSFTPNADWNGNVPVVTYTTNTGATATLTIVVTPVDDATNAVNDFNTVAEDTVASGNVLDNDSDVDDDLTVVSFEVNGNSYSAGDSVELDGGTLVLNADGSYSFTPNADWNGNVPVVTYTTNTGATATLTIVVTPVDDATNAVNDFNTVAEDTVASGNVLDNDSDIDSELSVVSFTIAGDETVYSAGDSVELDGGTLVLNADGSYSFTPNADWNGNVPVVTYTTNTGATATLTIVVTPVDDATNAVNDFNTVAEDTVASGNVLDNDSDVDDDLSVVSFEVNGNSYSAGDSVELDGGTLVLNADGSYSFTPNADWNGNVPVVTYTTNTGATATLTIVVTPENDEPVALANSYSVDEGDTVSGNIITDDTGAGVDSDPEGDELNITHINGELLNFVNGVATVAISGGTLTINQDGSFSYSHDGSEPVPISFTYTVSDGNGGTDTATVSITVNPVDDIAIANDDSFSVMEDQTSDALDLLGNDIGEGLIIKSINGVLLTGGEQFIAVDHGTIFISAEGEITFTPTANYSGPVTFDYVIEDLDGGEATATVTGTVIPVADIAGQEFGVTLGDVTEILINFDSGYTTYKGTGSHSNDIVKIVYEDGTTITTREGESLSVSNGQGIGVGRGGDFRIDGDDYMNIDLPSYLTDIALTFKNASGQTITFTMHNIDGTTTVQSYTFSGNQNSQETMVLHSEVAFNSFSFELSGSSNGGNGSTLLSMTTSGVTQTAYVYPITASYEFTDLDGSESIQSITLSGFPAGAKIYSAQDASLEIHDNGDGTWTIDSSVFTDNGGVFTFDDWVVQTQSPLENGFSPRLEIVIQDGADTSISIRGGSASSDLIGGDGNDYLDGESGDDMLIGGQGDDTLIGGLGADTFVWQAGDTGTDHIVDFDISQDKLDLSDLLQGEDQYSLEGFLSFTIENGSTTIEIDADKDGQVDQRIVLDGVDLAAEYGVEATNETGIINGLLGDGNGPLIIDTTSDSPGIQSVSSGSSTLDEQSHNFSGHYIP
ncbi:retention module-containing protein [Shewanella cyperi]|uniref:retention module-containing protein n=1 Tax=Shewanella cyperi TaxID=2814292 RepID=UPI001A947A68|nr:retention module-containing protein [Shewanella cyperi]QSX40552.1 retention module-containing protein [Shewanella cyperi]